MEGLLEFILREHPEEEEYLSTLMLEGIEILRWTYETNSLGIKAVEEIYDMMEDFRGFAQETIKEAGLVEAADMTCAEGSVGCGVIDMVKQEDNITYQKVLGDLLNV